MVLASLCLGCVLLQGRSASASEPPSTDPSWLEFLGPLITEAEAEVFRSLERRHEQVEFAERFWRARDPDPSTPRNELRQSWPDRIGAAEQQFDGVRSDRGRAFLLNGPPDFILTDLCPEILLPAEIWFYSSRPQPETDFERTFVFFRRGEEDAPRHWDPDLQPIESFLLEPLSGRTSADRHLARHCRRASEVTAALAAAVGPMKASSSQLESEWLDRFKLDIASIGPALDASLRFEMSGRLQGQTEVDAILTVRVPNTGDGGEEARLRIDGDIFRGQRRADHFRYEFAMPSLTEEEPIDVSFRRLLGPGTYRVALSARELSSGRSAHLEEPLLVSSPPQSQSARGEPGQEHAAASFKILPLPLGLLTGRQRVAVATSHPAVGEVVFLLNGRQIMKKSRPPFSVELDLGSRPRTHSLEAIARDESGNEIAQDSVQINTGPHRFSVRLVEPRRGRYYPDTVEVHADVNVPPGDTLDRVEFFFNETRIASFYQPPFIHPRLQLPESGAAGYVRAVAILDDENSAEDLVVVNTGSNVDRMRVDFVEIYAGVVDRKGRPIPDLDREDFEIQEDGTRQTIRRFETVKDLPINALVVLDTSQSMIEEIDEAKTGAVRFFRSVMQPKDRAAVVVFSDQPELEVPLTGDLGRLAAGLEDVEAEGETTLYDSVVFGLYYLVGLRGKRALILLTDGVDSRSEYSFDETLDFARFSGVAVYAIGIGLSSRDLGAQRVLRQLAIETGGDSYFIDSERDLERVYSRIESELRSQYLIGYQSTQSSSDDFRRLAVEVKRPGLEVRTISGYYP